MAADQPAYSYVLTGDRRAMVIHRRVGGGWTKVADTRSEYRAKELADGLNALRQSDAALQDIVALVKASQVGTQDPVANLLLGLGLLKPEDF